MSLVRIFYAAVLILAGFFFILYVDPLSLILFLVIAVIPVILFVLLLFARTLIKAEIDLPKPVADKGGSTKLTVTIKNRSFVSLSGIKISMGIINRFLGEEETDEIILSAPGFSTAKAEFTVSSEHIGSVEIRFNKMYLYDYFKLFSIPVKLNKTFKVSFLPDIVPAEVSLRNNPYIITDSDVFSDTKPGDDPSEVFKIRDYTGGDKLNRIHWKLSSKADKMMVKDFSLPLNTAILILLEFNAERNGEDNLSYNDTVIESSVCLSAFFADNSVLHEIGWFNTSTNEWQIFLIKDRNDLYIALKEMLNAGLSNKTATLDYMKQKGDKYSHIVYSTAKMDSAVADGLKEISGLSYITVFEALSENDKPFMLKGNFKLVPVEHNKAAISVCNTVL